MSDAKAAISALKDKLTAAHEEVCKHLKHAQIGYLQDKPLISLATGYTGGSERTELDLTTLIYQGAETSSRVETTHQNEESIDLTGESALLDGHGGDDIDTVKGQSDDGLSYEGTIVLGGIRRDSE